LENESESEFTEPSYNEEEEINEDDVDVMVKKKILFIKIFLVINRLYIHYDK